MPHRTFVLRVLQTLILTSALLASQAVSAGTFADAFFFGDSLTDEGRNGRTAPVLWTSEYRNDTSITAGMNYAIGGAVTSNQPSTVFGDSSYLGQINSFVATNSLSTANSVAGVWIGTNNVWIGSAQNQNPTALATSSSQDVRTGITTLAGAGVHNVLLLGVYDLSMTNAFIAAGANTIAVRDAAASASAQYNVKLAALAVPGTSIQFFNLATFIDHLQSNPQAYGFTQILPLQPGATCNAACQQTSIFDDVLHLSAKTQTLIGDYVASSDPIYNSASLTYGAIADNLGSSAASAGIPASLASSTAQAFAGSLLDRLDATRDLAFSGEGFARDERREGRSVFVAPSAASAWSVFAYGSVTGGDLGHAGNPESYRSDLDAIQGGLTGGAEYRISPAIRVGGAINYAHDESNLRDQIGTTTRIDAVQGALYASLATRTYFADGVVSGGRADLSQLRNGTFGTTTSSPRADVFTASGRGGYLFSAGPVRVGPVAGLAYSRTSIDGYRETGEALYAIGTSGQDLNSLYANGGIEIRLAGPYAAAFSPFVTATYNQQILRRGQSISTYLAALPTQTLPVDEVFANGNFVKVAFGSSFAIGPTWFGTVTAFGMAGQQSVLAGGLNGGLTHRF